MEQFYQYNVAMNQKALKLIHSMPIPPTANPDVFRAHINLEFDPDSKQLVMAWVADKSSKAFYVSEGSTWIGFQYESFTAIASSIVEHMDDWPVRRGQKGFGVLSDLVADAKQQIWIDQMRNQ